MPFRIYTYRDPYRLNACHFWEEIRSLPHLCVAQTLANAMKDLYGRELTSVICPIEDVLVHAYKDWHGNTARQIRQYSEIGRLLAEWKRAGRMDEAMYNALRHNRSDLLQAVRLFVELDISGDKLNPRKANREQKVFLELLKLISTGRLAEAFELKGLSGCTEFVEALIGAAGDDLTKTTKGIRRNSARLGQRELDEQVDGERQRSMGIVRQLEAQGVRTVVIHGVHQFTPLQLRLIQKLDDLGLDVIFLYNYQEKYSEIYSAWDRVYSQFGVLPEADKNISDYPMNRDSLSHALAASLAGLFNPEQRDWVTSHFSWQMLSSKLAQPTDPEEAPLFVEFDNVTEFANFVARRFDKAYELDKGNPISRMSEQVYSASREVHDLLKVYYPDYSGDRHFLAYPVGQFFVGLYRMWDSDAQELAIDMDGLAECLAAGVLRQAPAMQPTAIFHSTRLFYEDVKSFSALDARLAEYMARYDELHSEFGAPEDAAMLKQLSVYNEEVVSREDIALLQNAVRQLNDTARMLFLEDDQSGEFIKLRRHFEKLEEVVRQSTPELTDEAEVDLVTELLERFESLNFAEEHQGTIEDLREGLYYYLRQKERETERWIVRNFEQIDGDILLSQRQQETAYCKDPSNPDLRIYHFAGLSDKTMNRTTDDLLPWPLTDRFIQAAYFPVDLVFQVYYTALGEYKNFLRYALFYGLCFNKCDVRLSYVKHLGRDVVQPYFPLGVVGLTPQHDKAQYGHHEPDALPANVLEISPVRLKGVRNLEAMAYLMCPYSFMLDYVLNSKPVHSDKFVYHFCFVNLLIGRVWKQVAGKALQDSQEVLRLKLNEASKQLAPFFPFWRDMNELYDFARQAENYLLNRCVYNGRFTEYSDTHMNIRFRYRKAEYHLDQSETLWEHPDAAYRSLGQPYKDQNGAVKVKVSLYSVKDTLTPDLLDPVKAYISDDSAKHELPAEWCIYCPHKLICLKPYSSADYPRSVREGAGA